ncbi:helix-turn-helix domain-containing protein [Variovorax ginsengisoli]|uniref:Helix-turn-helix domain-containing protein n=1 Tax=Variovorax ginsengisoli TaxID=363844 RepID=A0ABT8SES2_9BURK|nr:helix-turn-helix domain-containing protein [Variovorax ginsengisoli]MDN8618246.1 helix-turn-helix domain-containing protein [Variovorax ginsengisoli]MDO1537416.1 helix-turn-helix domain-containing protein [Variovorax ginsengisoli]
MLSTINVRAKSWSCAMQPLTAEPSPRVIDASTAGLNQTDKFEFWQEVVCKALVDLECRPDGKNPFEASVSGTRLSALSVARIEASPHRVARLPAGISRSGDESLIFNFILAGVALAEQDGRSVVLKPGDGAVCDAQRPYYLRFDDAFKLITVKVPLASLSHRSAGVHRITARSLTEAGQMCPILFGYLVGLNQQLPSLDAVASEKVARNFTELLASALDEATLNSPLPLSEYRAVALVRVKDFLERNLDAWDLDATMVSAALNLSPRYINKLFEAENTSLARYIWRRRLERAASDLRDPARQSLGISAVAMAHGFNDLSHFSRAFRQRFEMSPRAYRVAGGRGPLE